MLAERRSGAEINAYLDDLTSWYIQIVPLDVRALNPRLLRLRRRRDKNAASSQHGYYQDFGLIHADLL